MDTLKTATSGEAAPQSNAEPEKTIDHCIAEIEKIRQNMVSNQRRIEELRTETRALLDETQVILDRLASS